MKMLYIWGPPASGKSTLVEALTRGQLRIPVRLGGVPLVEYTPAAVTELGVRSAGRNGYGGTDGLSMSIMPLACNVLAALHASGSWVLAEGDRLASATFFDASKAVGYDLELVYLDTPRAVCDERARQRGSDQSAAWVKGRHTKALHLIDRWQPVQLDGTMPVADLVDALRATSQVAARFVGVAA